MSEYTKMINLCKQIIDLDEEQKERYTKVHSKRLRRLFTEVKKTATPAKRELLEQDKKQ